MLTYSHEICKIPLDEKKPNKVNNLSFCWFTFKRKLKKKEKEQIPS